MKDTFQKYQEEHTELHLDILSRLKAGESPVLAHLAKADLRLTGALG